MHSAFFAVVVLFSAWSASVSFSQDVISGEVVPSEVVPDESFASDEVVVYPDGGIVDSPVPHDAVEFSEADLEGGDSRYSSGEEYLQDAFIRPGIADPSSRLMPFRAAQRLAKGLRLTMEAGTGYDSNTLLNNGFVQPGGPVPFFTEDIGHRGGMISYFRLNLGYSSGSSSELSKRVVYGFDIGGDIITYDRGGTSGGRDGAEPYIAPYVVISGNKTSLHLSTRYDLTEGNYLFSSDNRREAPVAEAQTYGFTAALTRELDRGTFTYVFSYLDTDFDAGTFLNDQSSIISDFSYMHRPAGMPKTQLGFGFRHGQYDTARNPEERFWEPSFRVSYRPTAKSSFDGRFGASFRDNAGTGPVTGPVPTNEGENARFTYAFGYNWNATARTRLRVEAYRDYSPSLVNAAESYDSDGFRLSSNYASPFWRLSMSAHVGMEWADYYSNVVGAGSNRDDQFFRAGLSIGRPINLSRWMDTSVSVFYDYSENKTNDFRAAYDRHFTGIRFNGSL